MISCWHLYIHGLHFSAHKVRNLGASHPGDRPDSPIPCSEGHVLPECSVLHTPYLQAEMRQIQRGFTIKWELSRANLLTGGTCLQRDRKGHMPLTVGRGGTRQMPFGPQRLTLFGRGTAVHGAELHQFQARHICDLPS